MSLPAGGHLTHGSPVTRSAKIYNFISYGVTEKGDIDYDELEKLSDFAAELETIRTEVRALALKFPVPSI